MIKFFRKIRQKLLAENKFTKYLLYAIGEIVLVMLGILLALQVNNANEERKNRALERAFLSDIHQDFLENKSQFEDRLQTFRNQYQLADSLCRQVFPITDNNWKGVKKVYGGVFLPSTFDPNRSSINALISSGRIDIIQNDSLKKKILVWNDKYEDYKESEYALLKLWDNWNEIMINEPHFDDYRDYTNQSIPLNLKLKLEKLMRRRRAELGLITSKWKVNQESEELLLLINSIISLTEPYSIKN
ncbi:DUF6090 family protein [Robiginitalea sp. IMCC44478]|uniref:DUF6090 family protein n=1 Tax=Robiginitalea sp. IMCC44478 TaxID=3459122 RepID=UPI004042A9C4